ncbi:NADPH-dependent ferric siderophore reductase, contains FAD-binding and SIP domains [Jatrophihabitans endophyticus]|uniref:NADPH-dependent ferric siderophore reductase, contains FAD-binding and SIP domains n=1 Tax=Jatrophihabitans endophyticus TaxID=1206085 RepID=A0A1M5GHZ0_9ACTN|nr:siderophore-interacting protein [Jatrophihabitans endophyticus]SHG03329.1 NADPH-dependent ferric siderophore reductase, contains FAD-binding and SIP domains [Jatrophihabitans endophyticus]
MLTSAAAPQLERDDRPPYRPFHVRVSRIRHLSPHFRRVTFTGADLDLFGRDGLDQRIKLLLPLPDSPVADLGADGDWYSRWLALPDERRNPLRTYTVRALRPEAHELDVDFVIHPHHGPTGHVDGPAARWLAGADAGSELVIVGPDVRSLHSASGIDWRPGAATCFLLAGDETAVPGIAGILASLDERHRVTVLVEVPDAGDAQELPTLARADVRWLARGDAERGARLQDAVSAWIADNPAVVRGAAAAVAQQLDDVDVDVELLWDSPDAADDGEFHAWLAGEAAVIKKLRRLLVTDAGVDRRRVAFMGYWRHGRAEQN